MEEEIGAEYDIPRAIRQQFTNWPAELKKLPARTTLYVIEVGERPVTYTLSGWDETFRLMWIINGQKHYMEVPWYHFLHPLIKGEPYNIKRHRTAMPALVPESNTQLTTAGCGCGGCCKFPDPDKPGGCRCGCECEDCKQHRLVPDQSRADAHMAQANPYTVTTGSFGDVLRKYKHAISNTDDVPAQWADIPEEPQKWKLEELGGQLTNMSRYNIVQWAKSRNISLKGLDETVEDWWNRLTRASRIELWQYARDWMVVTGNNITTRWSVQNFFRHKQWNLPPSEWLGAPKHEHVQEHVPKNWAEIPMADQWPIQFVLRNDPAWCMAHGIPAPPQVMGAPMVSDTDENWFTYRDFRKWWFHLTPTQRWLLWQKRGGSTTWEPPDLEKEKRHYEKSQAALKKIKSKNFDYNAPWQPPEHYKHFGFS